MQSLGPNGPQPDHMIRGHARVKRLAPKLMGARRFLFMALLTRLLNPQERRARGGMSTELYSALSIGGLVAPTASGITVTPDTALRNTAVLAAVRVLSESVASLPLLTYERVDRGKRRAPEHWLYTLLHDAPNPEMTAFEWRELGMVHLTLWGNFYNEIEFNRAGRPVALWPLRPDTMTIVREGTGLVYRYAFGSQSYDLPAERVFHVRGMGGDGIRGYSLVSLAREAIALGLAAQEFGSRFFGNGAVPGIVLQHPGDLGDEAYKRLKNSWNERHQGLEGAQRVAILEEGMTVEKIGIPPEDAQFLATRQFQVSEVARMFRIPPHMLMDLERATFSNIEHQAIDFVVHTLRPWLVRWEQAIGRQLLTPAELKRYVVEFLVDGLLRGDTVSRFQAYSIGRQWGWLSANEIRAFENANPVEGGDEYLVPMNMVSSTDEGGPQTAEGTEEATEQRGNAGAVVDVYLRRAVNDAAGARHRLMGTYRPVLANSAQRIVNREANDVRNAAARLLGNGKRAARASEVATTGADVVRTQAEFEAWLDQYYEQHAAFIVEYLAPVVGTYTDLVAERVEQELDKAAPQENLRRYAGGVLTSLAGVWIGESKARIRTAMQERRDEDLQTVVQDVMLQMQETRADTFAADASVRVNNAVAVAAYGMMGVTSKRWVAFGENCPYCTELNGRSVEIGVAFVGIDGMLEAAGHPAYRSGASIGHAPLHDGCDCMVVAG